MNRVVIILCLCVLILVTGCEKEDKIAVGFANIELSYNVDGEAVLFDTINYSNEAGNNYSISRLEYYISDITFLKSDEIVYQAPEIQYVNARTAATNNFQLSNVPEGDYDCIELTIGLNPQNNVSNSLPNTIDNINMVWPEPMGGGYHFVKMEGYFLDNLGISTGYAVHLGSDGYAIKVKMSNLDISAGSNSTVNIKLNMNINEWYREPDTYDFNVDANYTMGNMAMMQKLSDNGKDVFTAIID